jgi:hypothetical protein
MLGVVMTCSRWAWTTVSGDQLSTDIFVLERKTVGNRKEYVWIPRLHGKWNENVQAGLGLMLKFNHCQNFR